MRKIVSKWRTPFIGTRHRRHTLPSTIHRRFAFRFFFLLLLFSPIITIYSSRTLTKINTFVVFFLLLDSNNIHSRILTDDVHPINKYNTSPRLSIDCPNRPASSSISYSMQNTTSSSNLGAMGTGILPPPMLPQQSQSMQSTTPAIANGKDEMRGWLYKWTNVNLSSSSYPSIILLYFLVSQRLSKTLVCSQCRHSFLLSFS